MMKGEARFTGRIGTTTPQEIQETLETHTLWKGARTDGASMGLHLFVRASGGPIVGAAAPYSTYGPCGSNAW